MKKCLIDEIFWEIRDVEISQTLEEAKEHNNNISKLMHQVQSEIDKINKCIDKINE